jgi:hypothetical protein
VLKYVTNVYIGSVGNGNIFENLHYGVYHRDNIEEWTPTRI